jgi:hypothetical protein
MTRHTYDKGIAALLVVDPYNDFISEGGKIWNRMQIDHRRRHFCGAAALTVAAARLAMIIAAVTLAITSSATARQPTTHLKGFYALAAASNTHVTVDRNDPALTGGGSLGYNQRVEQGF